MDFDDLKNQLSDLMAYANKSVNKVISSVQSYFQSLDQMEIYGWSGEALGLVLVIAAVFFL